jgi:hypothetical protein
MGRLLSTVRDALRTAAIPGLATETGLFAIGPLSVASDMVSGKH